MSQINHNFINEDILNVGPVIEWILSLSTESLYIQRVHCSLFYNIEQKLIINLFLFIGAAGSTGATTVLPSSTTNGALQQDTG